MDEVKQDTDHVMYHENVLEHPVIHEAVTQVVHIQIEVTIDVDQMHNLDDGCQEHILMDHVLL